ncbi:DUF2017 family protein [Microbacterium sp. VKM Ac-2870]|uniref:DUF2017 family protein n=1 Tax=Microbacterium sp. VKM Ac-2870 TaxID=2783825 RepID=UPI00188B2E56|nr:DUF2017 family protein [Microbacterium sp. VKM Ac-2870]MBF4560751.1 DUF2017 family protein [Microbacterium sp. VKM Ac-2870]
MTTVVMELSAWEAAHLTDLVEQFTELLDETNTVADDPAVARLVPDAYADDVEAAGEFRRLTEADLLSRRRADADVVLASLQRDGVTLRPADIDRVDAEEALVIELDDEPVAAWLRTLTALRLVVATRLGVTADDDQDDDPRFGVYNWLGYRLEGLLQTLGD